MNRRARRALLSISALLGALILAPSSGPADTGDTVVSFTFDDIWADQKAALDVLAEHDMSATIYTISSRVGAEGSLGFLDLKGYLQDGFEIGGHTVDHVDLTRVSLEEVEHQVCDDRAKLGAMGFGPASFAYPHGAYNKQIKKVVKDCGYHSARALPGLRSPGFGDKGCLVGCPPAESIPPQDPYVIRTPATVRTSTTVDILEEDVTQAERVGGWVPLVFHHICERQCADSAMSIEDFTEFVDWLDKQPGTRVETVGQVMRPPPAAADYASLARAPALTVLGFGIGQSQVMALGLSLAVIGTVAYRTGTRRRRYVGRGE